LHRCNVAVNGHALQLGEGGLLRRVEARCHLTRPHSQTFAALALAWVPIVVLGIAHELATGRTVPLLHNVAVHVRLLVGTPVLLFLDRMFPVECRKVIDHLDRCGFVPAPCRARFDRLVARTGRFTGWWMPEVLLACAALAVGIAALAGYTSIGAVQAHPGMSAAEGWYGLVGLPLYEFLLFRSLWRWGIWVTFLVGLSRIDLDLDPTHPDRRAGLSVLNKPSLTYCAVLLFIMSAVLAAEWYGHLQYDTLSSFIPLLALTAAVASTIAIAPLLLFAPRLYRARRDTLLALGGHAAAAGRRWWRARQRGESALDRDAQSLAAISDIYRDTVKTISLVPFGKRELLLVLASATVPVLPVVFLSIPYEEWKVMLSLITKGGLP
jgi:hypothetical protein